VAHSARAIGVFDSGVGGLTVLAALCAELPREQFVYLGDTARLPYGTKSDESVVRYALQAAAALIERDVKALIVACNTASAAALPALRQRYPQLAVIGVVGPGADAAVAATRSGCIAVIGTEATVRGGAYQRAIAKRCPQARVNAVACQLFVALAEEGWTSGVVARSIAQRYLAGLFRPDAPSALVADTLVLGCTHFPLLQAVIREVVGEQVSIVDSAIITARTARTVLASRGLLRPEQAASGAAASPLSFLATEGAARFASIGARFLGRRISADEVELIDL
jgi:glutamate racemase